MTSLNDFIAAERKRFATRDSNLFAFAFAHIVRYQDYLSIIIGRHDFANEAFIKNTEELQKTLRPGTHETTSGQLELLEEGRKTSLALHFEIEAFYLFAKILLDRIARATEFYFGSERGLPLDSHDDVVGNFDRYVATKGLGLVSPTMTKLIRELKRVISDYRDYEIAHEKSPRTMKATVFNLQTRRARIASNKIYPTDNDKQVESEDVHEANKIIMSYVAEVVAFIEQNREKTTREKILLGEK